MPPFFAHVAGVAAQLPSCERARRRLLSGCRNFDTRCNAFFVSGQAEHGRAALVCLRDACTLGGATNDLLRFAASGHADAPLLVYQLLTLLTCGVGLLSAYPEAGLTDEEQRGLGRLLVAMLQVSGMVAGTAGDQLAPRLVTVDMHLVTSMVEFTALHAERYPALAAEARATATRAYVLRHLDMFCESFVQWAEPEQPSWNVIDLVVVRLPWTEWVDREVMVPIATALCRVLVRRLRHQPLERAETIMKAAALVASCMCDWDAAGAVPATELRGVLDELQRAVQERQMPDALDLAHAAQHLADCLLAEYTVAHRHVVAAVRACVRACASVAARLDGDAVLHDAYAQSVTHTLNAVAEQLSEVSDINDKVAWLHDVAPALLLVIFDMPQRLGSAAALVRAARVFLTAIVYEEWGQPGEEAQRGLVRLAEAANAMAERQRGGATRLLSVLGQLEPWRPQLDELHGRCYVIVSHFIKHFPEVLPGGGELPDPLLPLACANLRCSAVEKRGRRCGWCNRVRYCCEACQGADWRRHRVFCRQWRAADAAAAAAQ